MYIISIILSIWQSILFWKQEPGLSVVLFILPFIFTLIKILESQNKIKNRHAKLIAIPIILLSSTYFIFDNSVLNMLNKIAIPSLIGIMIIELLSEEFILEKIIKNVLKVFIKPISYFGVTTKNVVNKIRGKKEVDNKQEKSKNFKRIIKSILIIIPVLMIVLVLLISADESFSKLAFKIIIKSIDILNKIKISNLVARITFIVLAFLYIASFFENAKQDITLIDKKEKQNKDNLTVKMLITILNVVYLVFCIIQVTSLFKIYSMKNSTIDYAGYARQGFFQLMLVSAINLYTILISKREEYTERNSNYIKIMDIIMLALTFVILITSFIKMYIYQSVYGYTVKRILVFFALITEGILIVPTAMYVIDTKIKLAKIYFVTIISMYVVLNFINMNKMIAKKNVNLYIERGKLGEVYNAYYLMNLGTDAIEEIKRIESIKEEDDEHKDFNKRMLQNYMQETKNELEQEKTTFGEFNLSKYKAKKILQKN